MFAPKIASANGGHSSTSGSQIQGIPSQPAGDDRRPQHDRHRDAADELPRQLGKDREERQDERRVQERLGGARAAT